MPFDWRRKNCTQSDGTKGRWIVFNAETGEEKSCHRTQEDARKSAAAANAGSEDTD